MLRTFMAEWAIRKPLVTAINAFKRHQWCKDHKGWSSQQWQQVIWSDESSFTLFQMTGRIYVWRTPKEEFYPECLLLTVKHGDGAIMVWGVISWHGFGSFVILHGRITSNHYLSILADHVHPFVQTVFPGE
ncbi:Transposable element Tcb1 transposase, partial [Stegodyphus mimosarum]